jgi:hypothetical protein
MQRSKQKADRAAEAGQLDRVKKLLGLRNETKIDTLEAGQYNVIQSFAVHRPFGEVKATLTLLWPFFSCQLPRS